MVNSLLSLRHGEQREGFFWDILSEGLEKGENLATHLCDGCVGHFRSIHGGVFPDPQEII